MAPRAKKKIREHVMNARVLKRALREAEKDFVEPTKDDNKTVLLRTQEIATRPELFQPRCGPMGVYELDKEQVIKLQRLISKIGELDPILVVHIGPQWVIVDGHHRLEAYRKSKRNEPLRCEWFSGSLREAVDESVRRNAREHLPLQETDRVENAWRRILLGWGTSRAETGRLCGVSPRLIANMSSVKKLYESSDDKGAQFRARLGGKLEEKQWRFARMVWLNLEPQVEKSLYDQAETLARSLNNRFSDKRLSRDVDILAGALTLYDPDLAKTLGDALANRRWDNRKQRDAEEELDARGD